jgi:outer membrane protein OmpA-like peptidoglycan-associated protein
MGTGAAASTAYPQEAGGTLRRAAFFKNVSAQMTASGRNKLAAMVAALPKGARNVRVEIIGVSVGKPSVAGNIDLARDRAQQVARYFVDRKVAGDYTVSVSATFSIGANGRPIAVGRQPAFTRSGKPLTTAQISYDLAGLASP